MRLEKFSITKYRSILKSEQLPLGDLTVLVGPNNEGKSNLVQALVTGMQELASSRALQRPARRRPAREVAIYDWATDFPQTLQASQPNGKTTMNFDFALTEDEIGEFEHAVGSRLNGLLPIQLTFGPGRPAFSVRKQRHSAALSAKRTQIAQFVSERVQVQYIQAVRTAGQAAEIVRSMVRQELRAAASDEKYAEAIDRLRGLQQPKLDSLSEALSNQMQELLPDVKSVVLVPDERLENYVGGVRIVIDDGTPPISNSKGMGYRAWRRCR